MVQRKKDEDGEYQTVNKFLWRNHECVIRDILGCAPPCFYQPCKSTNFTILKQITKSLKVILGVFSNRNLAHTFIRKM